MAKNLITSVVFLCVIANSAVSVAGPVAPKEDREPLRMPVVVKNIFPEELEAGSANESKPSDEQEKDILKLGISKQSEATETKSSSPVAAVATSTAALIFVVGLFLLVMWFMKRSTSRGNRALPTEAFEILGRSSISQSQAVQLVRIGNKLLLVATSADSVSTLTEIEDTKEVTRLSGLCLQNHGTSATKEFHEALVELTAGSTESESSFDMPAAPPLLDQTPTDIDRVAFSDASLVIPTK